jgi:hypothetical protein
MPYHEQVAGSLDDIRKCDTIEERLSMFPNEGMRRAAEQMCILSEGSNAGKHEESDENYWEAPSDTEEEGCNLGKVPATPLKSDAINNVSPTKPNKSKTNSTINLNFKASDGDNNGTGNKGSPLRKMTTMMKARRSKIQYTKTMPVCAALGGENAKLITRGDVQYKFVYPRLECSSCCFSGEHFLSVGDDLYLRRFASGRTWYDSDFIGSLATLLAHDYHTHQVESDIDSGSDDEEVLDLDESNAGSVGEKEGGDEMELGLDEQNNDESVEKEVITIVIWNQLFSTGKKFN